VGAPAASAHLVEAFRQGLRELGYVEGKNLVIEQRRAEGRVERLPDLPAELVRLKVDVILASAGQAIPAAKNATGTIPIVTAATVDPVESGLVASLARPGGNITGLTFTVGPEIAGKRLELLKEAVPKASRVAVLLNPTYPVVQRF
jgi:putative ABC transport system substrate-binding protein